MLNGCHREFRAENIRWIYLLYRPVAIALRQQGKFSFPLNVKTSGQICCCCVYTWNAFIYCLKSAIYHCTRLWRRSAWSLDVTKEACYTAAKLDGHFVPPIWRSMEKGRGFGWLGRSVSTWWLDNLFERISDSSINIHHPQVFLMELWKNLNFMLLATITIILHNKNKSHFHCDATLNHLQARSSCLSCDSLLWNSYMWVVALICFQSMDDSRVSQLGVMHPSSIGCSSLTNRALPLRSPASPEAG